MKLYFTSGAEKGQIIDKDPAIARRLITIGAARLPRPDDEVVEPEPRAEAAPKRTRGRKRK